MFTGYSLCSRETLFTISPINKIFPVHETPGSMSQVLLQWPVLALSRNKMQIENIKPRSGTMSGNENFILCSSDHIQFGFAISLPIPLLEDAQSGVHF